MTTVESFLDQLPLNVRNGILANEMGGNGKFSVDYLHSDGTRTKGNVDLASNSVTFGALPALPQMPTISDTLDKLWSSIKNGVSDTASAAANKTVDVATAPFVKGFSALVEWLRGSLIGATILLVGVLLIVLSVWRMFK